MKVLKGIRIVFAVLTAVSGLYAAYALYMVWGDKLLYYHVEMGRWFSVTYKWAIAVFLLLILVDLALGIFCRRKGKDL